MGRLPKASDYLANILRGRIIGYGLAQGEALPSEGELMEEHHLSRATVRETLRLLEAEDIITVKRGPRGGVFVRHPDLRQVSHSLALLLTLSEAPLRDLFQFRAIIEPFAASLAARAADSDQRDELVRLADAEVSISADIDSWQGRVAVHGLIAEATHNELLRVVISAIQEVVRSHSAQERLSATDLEETALAHRKIAHAIAKGDDGAAERAMRLHLERYQARMAEQERLDEPIVPRSWWKEDRFL